MKEMVDNASNWEYMKERVILSPVGVDMNREMLSDLPHRTMGDIAGIYRMSSLLWGSMIGVLLKGVTHDLIWCVFFGVVVGVISFTFHMATRLRFYG